MGSSILALVVATIKFCAKFVWSINQRLVDEEEQDTHGDEHDGKQFWEEHKIAINQQREWGGVGRGRQDKKETEEENDNTTQQSNNNEDGLSFQQDPML